MNILKKNKNLFKGFGPAFLILALGIGSGEFILWPYLTANYGMGILWGALVGISLQLFLIQIISRNTLLLGQNILTSFSQVFSLVFIWVIFSTLVGFGWPGFSSLSSKLLVEGFSLESSLFLPLSVFILLFSAAILVFSKNAYSRILLIEKFVVVALLLLIVFLFFWYFNLEIFYEMILGMIGIGDGYYFIPDGVLVGGFLATFLGAIAYAGSGGNLLLANSFYILEEKKSQEKNGESIKERVKSIFKQNIVFFWGGGLLIISLLSYISYAVLRTTSGTHEDFSFLIEESLIFSRDISPFVGYSFIFLGAFVLFGVQLGIFDFLGRITKHAKNSSKKWSNKISDNTAYISAVCVAAAFGLIVFYLGIEKPKSLITIGAVINAFSMGVIALLLLLLEVKKVPKEWKSNKVILGTLFAAIFYISFFLYVVFEIFL